MRLIHSFDLLSFVDTVAALGIAFVLGGLIGLERQYRQRIAGLRTNVLVAVGAAAFADIGIRLLGAEGATRIVAYVVSGIGFLGAGVIMKDGGAVRGLNTAATLWCSAAVGALCGAGLGAEAVALTIFVLAGNTLLRPVVNYLNRQPIQQNAEAEYRVHAICDPEAVADVRDLMAQELERLSYPVAEIETLSDNEEVVELAAILLPTSADGRELDHVVVALERHEAVRSATWSVAALA